MRAEHEHLAAPEQIEHGFDEGLGHRPRRPAKRRVGSFADGIAVEDRTLKRRRFSEGLELTPDAPANNAERRFSEGIERGSAPALTASE
jgi:hypothetical protein